MTVTELDLPGLRLATLRTLLVTQILGSVGLTAGFAISALAATQLAGSPGLAGAATALSTVGTVAATVALARITAAAGRRRGLTTGYLAAAVGAGLCATAVVTDRFWVFVVGGALFGAGGAANFQTRFAGADLSAPGTAARGISLVVWASTIGAVIGPNTLELGARAERRSGIDALGLTYLVSGVCFTLAALVVLALLRPDPLLTARRLWALEESGPVRRHRLRDGVAAVAASPAARFALAVSVTAHAVMVGVMTWTPLHMAHGAAHTLIGPVLSGHLLGMFAFAPLFGWAAARTGPLPVIAVGSVVMVGALVLAATASSDDAATLAVALFLLGIAWSLIFITGSGMLTESMDPEVRAAAQGVLDVTIWVAAAGSIAVCGWVVGEFGYRTLCLAALVGLAPATVWAMVRVTPVLGRAGRRDDSTMADDRLPPA